MTGRMVAVGFVACAALAAIAGDATWVGQDGSQRRVAVRHAQFVGEGETIDLKELGDGEHRVIVRGDKRIEISREGDIGRIVREASGDSPEHVVSCRLSSDTCRVVVGNADDTKVAVIIEKHRECIDGQGDCEAEMDEIDAPGVTRIVVRNKVVCDDSGKCETLSEVDGNGSTDDVMVLDGVSGSHAVMFVGGPQGNMLRCPEGDTTMHVAESDLARGYNCPQHGLPLERVTAKMPMRTIHVEAGAAK
jgi:hypothetical protein